MHTYSLESLYMIKSYLGYDLNDTGGLRQYLQTNVSFEHENGKEKIT